MQKQGLKLSLISAIVFMSLSELVVICNAVVPRLLSLFETVDPYRWSSLSGHISSVMICGLYLSLFIAGVCLLAGNRKSVPACVGGGLIAFHGLLSFTRIVLYYIFRSMENMDAVNLLYHKGVTWFIVILYAAALIMVAVHYHHEAMIGLAVAKAVTSAIVHSASYCLAYGWITAYTVITGIGGFIGFVLSLLFLILWLRRIPKE